MRLPMWLRFPRPWSRQWGGEVGSRKSEVGVWSVECGVRSAECGVRSAECGVRSAEFGMLLSGEVFALGIASRKLGSGREAT